MPTSPPTRTPRIPLMSSDTLVPLGVAAAVLVCMVGVARWLGTFETRTDLVVLRNGEAIKALEERAEAVQADLSTIKAQGAATDAKLDMLIDHLGIERRRRR